MLRYFNKITSAVRKFVPLLISTQVFKKNHHTPPPPPPPADVSAADERDDQISISITDDLLLLGEVPPSPEMTVIAIGTLAITEAPPSAAAASAAAAAAEQSSNSLNTINLMVREREMGKVFLALGAGAIGFVIMNHEKLEKLRGLHFMLTGLVIGFGSTTVGIVTQKYKPVAANVIEQLGIVITSVSCIGLVACYLPPEFAWVVFVFGAVSISPFAVAIFLRAPAHHVN